jgi:hypothetical protein
MRLDCYVTNDAGLDIRPASSRRAWMDATDERFAYRCLPLSIANAHGWVICCGGGFEAEWNGGEGEKDVEVFPLGDGPVTAYGHFGYGILTFSPQAMFRTDPEYNLWITGPPNSFKDAVQPLSAVVETDWMPYTFSMNWKITRPNQRIRFEKGEPYCFLFPVPRGLAESMEPELKDIRDDPESHRQVEYAKRMRFFLANVKQMKEETGETARVRNEKRLNFQMWYMKGQLPDGTGSFDAHQKSLQLRPFRDRRTTESKEHGASEPEELRTIEPEAQ